MGTPCTKGSLRLKLVYALPVYWKYFITSPLKAAWSYAFGNPELSQVGRNCPYVKFTNLLIRYVYLSRREAIIQKVIVLEGQIQNFSIHFRIVH